MADPARDHKTVDRIELEDARHDGHFEGWLVSQRKAPPSTSAIKMIEAVHLAEQVVLGNYPACRYKTLNQAGDIGKMQ